MTGTVFDIKEMTVHDGPGSRVTVFLKGCPLRCMWCHNPEGLDARPELMVKHTQCMHCGLCMRGCSHPECKPFGRCLHACPKGLVTLSGTPYTSEKLAEKLNAYKPFLNAVGGGVTFSGGEPLLQANFVYQTAKLMPDVHKALQTSGYADAEVFEKVISVMDYCLFDIKIADCALHKKYTGVENTKILNNYKILVKSGLPHVVRIPLIPGITDTAENLKAISQIVGNDTVEIMRYNRMAGAKYPMVNREFALPDLPSGEVDISVFKNARIL